VSAAWVDVKVESERVKATAQAAATRFNFMLFPVFVEKRKKEKERKQQKIQSKPNTKPNPLFAVGVFLSTTVLFLSGTNPFLGFTMNSLVLTTIDYI
jgi:hypothetical protein